MNAQKKNALLAAVADHLRYLQANDIQEVPTSEPSPDGQRAIATPSVRSAQNDSEHTLHVLRTEIGDCTRCKLCRGRTHIVFGVGNPRAKLMFVGEGPGADEDTQGEPFVGRAGQLLNKIIEAMGYRRSDVYIANVVMCRPPQNRAPDPDEIAMCLPFLWRKIAAVRPTVIVCLGGIATQALLKTDAKISTLRGRFHETCFPASAPLHVMPTFHPAYLLRNPEQKRAVWEDMKKVATLLKGMPPP